MCHSCTLTTCILHEQLLLHCIFLYACKLATYASFPCTCLQMMPPTCSTEAQANSGVAYLLAYCSENFRMTSRFLESVVACPVWPGASCSLSTLEVQSCSLPHRAQLMTSQTTAKQRCRHLTVWSPCVKRAANVFPTPSRHATASQRSAAQLSVAKGHQPDVDVLTSTVLLICIAPCVCCGTGLCCKVRAEVQERAMAGLLVHGRWCKDRSTQT